MSLKLSNLALIAMAAWSACAAVPCAALEIRVDANNPGPRINPNIYGQFMEHLGRGIYGGLWVGPDADIPNRNGMRIDVIEALEALQIPVIRWPGGCYADEYHWRDGIGPPAERPVTVNTSWGGVEESNAFGTHEFFELLEMLGAEAYIAGNLGTGTPREMAEWLEYMTSDTRSTLAELRRANGRDEPWRVAYFGVGNESWGCGGNMRPEYYADLYRHYAEFLEVPAGNRLRRIASGGFNELTEWTEELSRIDEDIDGISHHYYTLPTGNWNAKGSATHFGENEWISTLRRTLRIDDYIGLQEAVLNRNDPRGRIGIYFDEWGTWYDPPAGGGASALYQQNTLRDALAAALNFHVFHRHAERVHMANIAQTINVLQAMILTDGARMIRTPTYHVFRMYIPFQGATHLPVSFDEVPQYEYAGLSVPAVSATAARGADGRLYVSLVNLDPGAAREVTLNIDGAGLGTIDAEVLTADAINSHNTFEAPESVVPVPFTELGRSAGSLSVRLPAKSIVMLAIQN